MELLGAMWIAGTEDDAGFKHLFASACIKIFSVAFWSDFVLL
jgi:hypothetical protein